MVQKERSGAEERTLTFVPLKGFLLTEHYDIRENMQYLGFRFSVQRQRED